MSDEGGALAEALEGPAGRVLALDVGSRRIGLALSDPSRTLASTAGVIIRRGPRIDIQALRDTVHQVGATRVVVGLPLSLSGGVGPQAQSVLDLVERLKRALQVPVDTWDERYSSVEAEAILRGQGVRSRKIRARVDEVAAATILQGYLDARRAG